MSIVKTVSIDASSAHSKVLARAAEALGEQQKAADGPDFAERMGSAIREVADAQSNSADLTKAFELGEEHDLAKVMVSQQVSSLSFQMVLNIRNKVLSAYKDIMNMPV